MLPAPLAVVFPRFPVSLAMFISVLRRISSESFVFAKNK
jgi:hypothetical protein